MLNKLHKIATSAEWLMRPVEHASMMKIIERMEDVPKREGVDICGDATEFESMRIQDGTAIIPIRGVMVHGLKMVEKVDSVVCVEDIEKDIKFAMESSDVKRVVFDIDSPGGMYNGTPELGDVISKYKGVKPMAAFTNGLMASAAYWTGITSGSVYMSRSASVGSIGVVMMWPDVSKAMEGEGVKIKVFSSGEFKGMTPEVELTGSQESYLQSRVMSLANEFYSHVKEARAGVNESAFDGRTFQAAEAMELGLVDGLARNVEEVISIMTKQENDNALLVQKVDQQDAKIQLQEARIKSLETEISALGDLITEADAKKPEPKAQESLTAEDVEKLVAKSASANAVDYDKLAGMIASKMIASTGQPGPIPGNTGKTLTAQERTEAHFSKVARQMKGIE
jgi:capsid assembly protease